MLYIRGCSDNQSALPLRERVLEHANNPLLEAIPVRGVLNFRSLDWNKVGQGMRRHGGNILLWLLEQHGLLSEAVRFGRCLRAFSRPGSFGMMPNSGGTQVGDAWGVHGENPAVEEAERHGGGGEGAA